MAESKIRPTILERLVSPVLGNHGKSDWFEGLFYILGELQIIFLIFSISFPNSYLFSSKNSPVKLSAPTYDFIFGISLSQDMSNSTLAALGTYIGFLYALILAGTLYPSFLTLKYLYNGFLIVHRDWMGIIVHKILIYALSGPELPENIKAGAALLVVLNILLWIFAAVLCCSLYYENSLMGLNSSKIFVANMVYKVIDVLIECFINLSALEIVRVGVSWAYLLLVYFVLIKFPFYRFSTMITAFWLKSAQIAVSIAVFFRWVLDYSVEYTAFLSMVLTFLLGNAAQSLIFYKMELMFKTDEERISDPRDMSLKISALEYVFKTGARLTVDQKAERSLLLLLARFSGQKVETLNVNSLQGMNTIIRERINRVILEKFSKNIELMLMKINYELHSGDKILNDSIFRMSRFSQDSNMITRIISSRILKRINTKLVYHIDHDSNLNINEIAQYYDKRNYFYHLVRRSVQKYIEYWEYFLLKPTAAKLFAKSILINEDADNIEKTWLELTHHPQSTRKTENEIFLLYLHAIRFAPKNIIKLTKDIRQNFSDMRYKSRKFNNIAVLSQYKSETELSIVTISEEILDLGYTENELLGKPVETILTTMFQNKNLIKQFEEGSNSVIVKEYPVFIKDRVGNLILMNCFASPIIHSDRLCFLIIFSPTLIKGEFMLVSKTGIVFGATGNIASKLQTKEANYTGRQFSDLCKVSWEEAKSSGDTNPHFRLLKGNEDFKMLMEVDIGDSQWRITVLPTEDSNWFVAYFLPSKKKNVISTLHFRPEKLDRLDISFLEFSDCNESIQIETLDYKTNENMLQGVFLKPTEDLTVTQVKKVFFQSSSENTDELENKSRNAAKTIQSENFSISSETLLLEKTVNTIVTAKNGSYFKYGLYLQLLISLGMLLGYIVYLGEKLDEIQTIFSLTKFLFNRSFYLWIWTYWNSEVFLLQQKGLLGDRLGFLEEDFYYFCIGAELGNAQQILQVSNNMSIIYQYFEPSIQQRFLAPIRVHPRENFTATKVLNIFTFDREISSSLLRLMDYSYLPYGALEPDNPDLFFTSKNILDDHLIVQDDLQFAIRDDIFLKLDNIHHTETIILIVIIIVAIFTFAWLIKLEIANFIKKRNFLETMFQIKDEEIRVELTRIRALLEGNRSFTEKFNEKQFAKAKKNNERRRITNYGNFSKTVLSLVLVIFIVIFAVVMVSLGISLKLDYSTVTSIPSSAGQSR